ncbi:hypothetical protein HGRIS_007293 [Hohenbuehelia grisea]|uniref:Dihydroorotate oxidase n=1 Tax=Hohenbuehelia grisea TaxID=104357 RepID=A0ABR3J4P9_9AGAR
MVVINSIDISPPLINTSCAWASDKAQLEALFACQHTGAVTTRTATLEGFAENNTHTVVFNADDSTLNSYGYSPHPLKQYLQWIPEILTASGAGSAKPFILSITSSSAATLRDMISAIQAVRHMTLDDSASTKPWLTRIAIELNTSCPNIASAPPSAYAPADGAFPELLSVIAEAHRADSSLTIGLKLPPFVYTGQFHAVLASVAALSYDAPAEATRASGRVNPVAFFTCTNTLGNSLFFASQVQRAESDASTLALPTGLGGLAGSALHPLALGNVFTFRNLLDASSDGALGRITIIGVGGVTDTEGTARMHAAGAKVVGAASALGKYGVTAFEKLRI